MRTLMFTLALLACASLQADTLTIPVGSQGEAVEKPSLGLDMASVKRQYGEPEKVHGPTGEPPITRWDYPQFSVYFEHQTVLHSVTRHRQPVSPSP